MTTRSGPPTTGLNTVADGAADDEVRAEVVHAVDAKHHVPRQRALHAEVELLDGRILQPLSMMLIPDAPAPGRMNPVNGFASDGANGGKLAGCRIDEEGVAGPHFDRQRAPVETALERLQSRASSGRSRCRIRRERWCARCRAPS